MSKRLKTLLRQKLQGKRVCLCMKKKLFSNFYFTYYISHHLLAEYLNEACKEEDHGAPLMMKQNNR